MDREQYERPWGGIPSIYSFGDNHQLPPFRIKPLYSTKLGTLNTADIIGQVVLTGFLNHIDNENMITVIFVIEDVMRQDNPKLLSLLHNVRGGNVNNSNVSLIESKASEKLHEEQHQQFNNSSTLTIVPTLNKTYNIVYEHLLSKTSPIANILAKYQKSDRAEINHCIKESSLVPKLEILEGAVVMLLQKFVCKRKIMNFSIGIARYIVYKKNLIV